MNIKTKNTKTYIKYFPFRDLKEDRVNQSIEEDLFECVDGIWRLTTNCRQTYDEIHFLKYLQGLEHKPIATKSKTHQVQAKDLYQDNTITPRQQDINYILSL